MRPLTTTILAGCAALAIAGIYQHAGAKSAVPQQEHVLTVQLPDGQVEQISYSGNVAPGVYISDSPFAAFISDAPAAAPVTPFADIDQMMASMDQQIDQMMQQNQAMALQPFAGIDASSGELTQAAFGKLPAGASSYLLVSTLSPKGECTRSVEVTEPTNGGVQHVVSHDSGNCRDVPSPTVTTGAAHAYSF